MEEVKQEGNSQEFSLNTAVLFLIFNRLDTTKKVFESIKIAKPPRLYIAADGPRENKSGEKEICEKVQKFVMSNIDWDCEVKTLFREKNLGCKYAVSSAIDWFFDNEEMGIILEDDCLPSQSFFRFCEELLVKYKDDKRIMRIGGYNLLSDKLVAESDYFFTHLGQMWGWASWKRSWSEFDVEMKDWQFVRNARMSETYPFNKTRNKIFEKTYNGEIDTWDYQFDFAIAKNAGLSIVPTKSLIQNIGFGDDATHTFGDGGKRAKILASELKFPLKEPRFVFDDADFKEVLWKHVRKNDCLFTKTINKVKIMIKKIC